MTGALIGLARATDGNTTPTGSAWKTILKGLFTTVTNVNFNDDAIRAVIHEIHSEKEKLIPQGGSGGAPCNRKDDFDMDALWNAQEDVRSLKSLILFGLRGMAAYAYHAMVLGCSNEELNHFFYKSLFALGEDLGMDELLPIVMDWRIAQADGHGTMHGSAPASTARP